MLRNVYSLKVLSTRTELNLGIQLEVDELILISDFFRKNTLNCSK